MTCRHTDLGNGDYVITCEQRERGRVHHCSCNARASIRCDYPLRGRATGKTCDTWLCARCAREVGENTHYCQPHARMAAKP